MIPEDPDDADAHVLVAAALLQRHAELGDGTAVAEAAPRQGAVSQDPQSGCQLHTDRGGHSLTTAAHSTMCWCENSVKLGSQLQHLRQPACPVNMLRGCINQ